MLAKDRTRICRERHEVQQSLEKYNGIRNIDYVVCEVCGKRGLYIDARHLKTRHGLTKKEYTEKYPDSVLVSKRKSEAQARPNNKVNLGRIFSEEHRKNMSLARRNGVPWSKAKLKRYAEYKAYVRHLTEQTFRKHYYYINPEDLNRGLEVHLDHIYSVYDGFCNNVDPRIIAHRDNLRMLYWNDNLIKSSKSDMTLARLFQVAI